MPDFSGPFDRLLSRRVLVGALTTGLILKIIENLIQGNLQQAAYFAVAATLMVLLYAVWPILERD